MSLREKELLSDLYIKICFTKMILASSVYPLKPIDRLNAAVQGIRQKCLSCVVWCNFNIMDILHIVYSISFFLFFELFPVCFPLAFDAVVIASAFFFRGQQKSFFQITTFIINIDNLWHHQWFISFVSNRDIIYVTYNLPFKVYKPLVFSIFIMLNNRHCCLISGHFHHPQKKTPVPISR